MQPKQNGYLHITTSPGGAKIYIDGLIQINPVTEESIKTPATISVIEGRRDYRLVLEGHKILDGYVDIFPGKTTNITRNFEPGKSSDKEEWGKPEPQIWLRMFQNRLTKSAGELFGMK